MYKIEFIKTAAKNLEKIHLSDHTIYRRLSAAIETLSTDPFQGKPLKHSLKGCYSLHVGSHRIIYNVEKKIVTVYILDIGHRKHIYHQ